MGVNEEKVKGKPTTDVAKRSRGRAPSEGEGSPKKRSATAQVSLFERVPQSERLAWPDIAAILSGVVSSLSKLMGGGIAYGWQSLLLDYALAYALTGLAGFTPKKPVLGTVIGALGALLSFVLSGVFVWGEYMPDVFLGMAMKNVWIYSFIYNFIYTAFNWLIAAIVIYFLSKKTKLLQPEK